ncbi:Uncharacterised protein [Mycobacterium tuberculosis]|nr:Uncharacterised protein [Mycobacterium tuberculosis]
MNDVKFSKYMKVYKIYFFYFYSVCINPFYFIVQI